MKMLDSNKAKRVIAGFSRARVLVIGDLILDQFIWGDVSRISPEAPVPVVWVKRESFMPGGASNVANNLRSLGAEVHVVGVIGDDEHGAILRGELDQKGMITRGIISDGSRPTILKTRVVAQHQQVVRIDREKLDHLDGNVLDRMTAYVREVIDDVDAIIIEDYGKGLITSELLKKIVPLARRKQKILAVDPKEEHFNYYKGATVITPNNHEAARAVGFAIKDADSLQKAGERLLRKLDCAIALITLGENGMAVFQKGRPMRQIPTVAQEVFDVSGAGDTVIASYTLSMVAGADPVQAAYIANCAAGIVVGKIGIAVVEQGELVKRIRRELAKRNHPEKGRGL